MGFVEDQVKAIEARQPKLSENLKRLLDLIWSHRNSPHLDIYGLYTGSPAFSRKWVRERRVTSAQMENFLSGLVAIGRQPEIQGSAETDRLINYKPAKGKQDLQRRTPPVSLDQLRMACRRQRYDWLMQDLGSAFYHFRSRHGGVSERIYLNVHPAFAVTVISWAVRALSFSAEHPACVNVKVGGPLENRFDTIVIYLTDRQGVDKALAEIAKYQKRREVLDMFDHAAPHDQTDIERGIDGAARCQHRL